MFTVERAESGVVERVVVKPRQPLAARNILPDPFLESLFDPLLLLARGFRGLGIDNGFFVGVEVVHRGCPEIQRVFNQFEPAVAVRAPIGRVPSRCTRLPISVYVPGAERVDVADFDTGREVEQCLGKLLHVVMGNPRRAKTDINIRRR